jgi:hypothetical protein
LEWHLYLSVSAHGFASVCAVAGWATARVSTFPKCLWTFQVFSGGLLDIKRLRTYDFKSSLINVSVGCVQSVIQFEHELGDFGIECPMLFVFVRNYSLRNLSLHLKSCIISAFYMLNQKIIAAEQHRTV